ncbi:MAG TPA: hypothetical protein QGF51_00750 [Candidatus Marinimicrobia bacterium]|jgi:hypothetical protein|nr:hypothetical protein [Candidatus Neomarinimicrobiota bacterium]MDP6202157.1 hypothetical protein [Candidatus Neomarinimicrobiota bacterium]HJN97481.1 hypothetical protein [Candidatus Neomarinimicrobiota bacterium]|tara:strand:- start:186 stop:380 length:195 start_codon:yes stop_codon:yes gene_type:complete
MENIDWRIRLAGGAIMMIGGILAVIHALELRSNGEDFNQFGILAMLAIWGGCDWIIKGIQGKNN